MSKNYNLDGDIYKIVDIPISELEGQKLALMEYEGIYRLDNGFYLKARALRYHEWLSQGWGDEEGLEPLGAVYYEIYQSLAADAIDIDGGVMGYDLHSTIADFNLFLGSAAQGQIIRKIGVVL